MYFQKILFKKSEKYITQVKNHIFVCEFTFKKSKLKNNFFLLGFDYFKKYKFFFVILFFKLLTKNKLNICRTHLSYMIAI